MKALNTAQVKAVLQSDLSKASVDKDARIIRGVRVIENNRLVTYKGDDGKAKSFTTNSALLKGLLGFAEGSIPSHFTHDWTNSDKDPLHARCGTLKDFTLTEEALLADFHVWPGENGDKALWLAENDPKNAALSAIFDYNAIKSGEVTYAVPLNFQSADVVAKGAACTALLSQFNPNETDMTKEEIVALIKENAASKEDVTSAVKAALAEFKPATPEGFVTKAELAEFKPKLSDEELIAVEAKVVAKLGAGPLQIHIGDAQRSDTYSAKLAEYKKLAPNPATAVSRLLRDHPELGTAHEEHLQKQVAMLGNGQSV